MSQKSRRFNVAHARRDASAIILVDIFHALKVPEPHVALVTPEDIDDGYYRFGQFDVFRPSYTIEQKSSAIRAYLGNAAMNFTSARKEEFRGKLVALAEKNADPTYDRPVWVDRAGQPMTINQILPETQILDAAYSSYRDKHGSSVLNGFVERSLVDLGDRVPVLPNLN